VDISTDRAKLHNQLKDLNVRWQELHSIWDDPVRKEFEETYWLPMEAQVHTALRAMDQLAAIMTRVRHDCS